MKNSEPHTIAISMVCPKSGCIISSVTTEPSSASAMVLAGMSGLRADSANSQAIRITKAGLTNSDGWMLTPSSTIQRRAPLISVPNTSVPASSTMLTANTTSASRRIWCGDSSEVPSMMAIAGSR